MTFVPRPGIFRQAAVRSLPTGFDVVFENIFETINSGFAQALYEDYLDNPNKVPPEWRAYFDRITQNEDSGSNGAGGPVAEEATAVQPGAGAPTGDGSAQPAAASIAGDALRAAPAPAAPQPPPSAPASAATQASPPAPATSISSPTAPIKGPALRLLQNMEASLAIPTATSFRDVDVGRLWSERGSLNQRLASRNLKLSFTHLIGWALVQAIRDFPAMAHAVIQVDGAPHRLEPPGTNLGLAVDVERKDGSRGLLVPVIKGADRMSFREFHAEYERLVAGARESKLLPDAYQGATITLTNPGTLGTTASVPRLMTGQGSIIATGTIQDLAGAKVMTLSSTYDHRIIQGAESGSFLRRVDQLLQGDADFYRRVAEQLHAAETPAPVEPRVAAPVTATPPAPAAAIAPAAPSAESSDLPQHVAAAMSLVKAHRTVGHHAARLDPLGQPPVGDPALDPEPLGLTPDIAARIPASILRVYVPGATLAEALPRLHEVYCGTIAYEIEHIASHEIRVWLRQVIESGQHRRPFTADERRTLLSCLTRVETLERFLQRSYLGSKRFGAEGLDMLVPMLLEAIELAADQGVFEIVFGMPHRGRLNALTHVLGLPYETLLAEFEGGRHVEETLTPKGGTGDVKYHHGATGQHTSAKGKPVQLTLLPNPSHLEAVDPVVVGRTRAVQTNRRGAAAGHDSGGVLAVLVHGDAAFAGQGVVAETFNLERLAGYQIGGTLHIIGNNQVGFTTDPAEARSTDYASDLAKGFDVPIIHVNADDPEACIAAVRLAMMYRARFHGDCVIDVVGYRRHGHNEADEPRYTQPLMYQRVDQHPTVREQYAATLVRRGVVAEADAAREAERQYQLLASVQQKLKADLAGLAEGHEPQRISAAFVRMVEPGTTVAPDTLRELNHQLLEVPEGFTPNPKLKRQLDRRLDALNDQPAIDWGHAEALAFASLLIEGVPIRLTGQDSERGTFSQRHVVLHDSVNGQRYAPIQHLPGARAPMELHNSPLSEFAVLGFEYGYSIAAPEALVLWEAQFGDFANNAQVVIDQFIIAGLSKWGQTSRLVLLLPHGYEGQGPEHSSARLERFLALGAEGNIRVANCSTPAQYFHLLRRQAKLDELRPLVLMTPKSLLRLPQAASRLSELATRGFQPVLDDPTLPGPRDSVSRVVLCSGKVFYDLSLSKRRAGAGHVALGRIELLYPFPRDAVAELLANYPRATEVVWVQEEPENLGARKWIVPQVQSLVAPGTAVRVVCRPERSSPAEGYPAAHQLEQERIVTEALQ